MYNQGSDLIGHELIKSLIKTEYSITYKPSTLRNPTSNAILVQINQVLVNLVRTFNIAETYVDKDDSCSGILSASEFTIISTKNSLKYFSLGQLLFGRDLILPIKNKADWELICQIKQTKFNKDNILKNSKRVDHGYKVRDKVMIENHTAYKYETLYKVPFVITQCWTNRAVTLQCSTT